jgi:hypothetical protein
VADEFGQLADRERPGSLDPDDPFTGGEGLVGQVQIHRGAARSPTSTPGGGAEAVAVCGLPDHGQSPGQRLPRERVRRVGTRTSPGAGS